MTCSVGNCGRPVKTSGLCGAHYQKKRTYGDPLAGKAYRHAISQIEAALSSETDDCIFWTGAKRPNGYGNVNYRGVYYTASRLSCLLAHGEPSDSTLEAAHSCGNGHLSCINPKHLRWATQIENAKDKIIHGTSSRGESRPRIGMTEKDARMAKQLLREDNTPVKMIAAICGAKPAAIYDIKSGKAWAWL